MLREFVLGRNRAVAGKAIKEYRRFLRRSYGEKLEALLHQNSSTLGVLNGSELRSIALKTKRLGFLPKYYLLLRDPVLRLVQDWNQTHGEDILTQLEDLEAQRLDQLLLDNYPHWDYKRIVETTLEVVDMKDIWIGTYEEFFEPHNPYNFEDFQRYFQLDNMVKKSNALQRLHDQSSPRRLSAKAFERLARALAPSYNYALELFGEERVRLHWPGYKYSKDA